MTMISIEAARRKAAAKSITVLVLLKSLRRHMG
jgi:hypothetical protein